MRIYIAHSKNINYIDELYKPLRNDDFFKSHDLILPHESNLDSSNTREFYKTIDIFIAECSEHATGLGIELGWAFDDGKKIYCIYKHGKNISNSIKVITKDVYEYRNSNDMLDIIKKIIENVND